MMDPKQSSKEITNATEAGDKVCAITEAGVNQDVTIKELRHELLLEGQEDSVEEASLGQTLDFVETAEAANDETTEEIIEVAQSKAEEDREEEEGSSEGSEVMETIEAQIDPEKTEEDVQEELAAEVADQLAQIEPAAGEEGGGQADDGGAGFQSNFDPQGVIPIEDVGPLDPTALIYGFTPFDEESDFVIFSSNETQPLNDSPDIKDAKAGVDESDFGTNGELVVKGKLDFNFGGDGAGTIGGNGVFASPNGDALTSNGAEVKVGYDADTGTYTGVSETGEVIFTMQINPDGTFVFTQMGPLDHPDGTDPNDILPLQFGVFITDGNGDTSFATITINVADDGPEIQNSFTPVSENDLSNGPIVVKKTLNHDFGADGGGQISGTGLFQAFFQVGGEPQDITSGGEAIKVESTDTGGYIGMTESGEIAFTLEIDPATGEYIFTQYLPVDHPDGVDVMWLTFQVQIIDADGDISYAYIGIDLHDGDPTAQPNELKVDETDLDDGDIEVKGKVDVNFGGDGPGEVNGNGEFKADVDTLTSGGEKVEVKFDADTGTYTGVANGEVIFTLEINADGTYTFTLLGPLDHPDGTDPNDAIQLNFGVIVTDGDGDSVFTTITINVLDDGPEIHNSFTAVSENDLTNGPIVVKKTLNHDFGSDGNGEISGTGLFQAFFQVGGEPQDITSGGQAIKVESTDTGGYVGLTEDGEIAFTLEIDPVTGEYIFTQYLPVDHPDGVDVMWLTFQVQIIDADGDISYAYIGIDLHDGTPDITGAASRIDETDIDDDGAVVKGKVEGEFGGDGAGEISGNGRFAADVELTSGGEPVEVSFNADTGMYTGTTESGEVIFTLEINADGTYVFTLLGSLDHPDSTDPNDVILLNFGVVITDADGDSVATKIQIGVLDDGPEIHNQGNGLNEANLENGPVIIKNQLNVDFGNDGAGEVTANGTFMAVYDVGGQPQQVTSGGEVITVRSVDGGYVGLTESGEIAFTLRINTETGEYEFTLHKPIDHPPGSDVMWLKFGVTVTDGDGDTDTAFISIDVHDDGPQVVGNKGEVDETDLDGGDAIIKGEVRVDFGADGAGEVNGSGRFAADVAKLTSNGEPVEVKFDADTGTYTGVANGEVVFTLEINADGSYVFTLLGPIDHPDSTDPNDAIVLSFGVLVTDADGDTAQAGIHITVLDDGPEAHPSFTPISENALEHGPITVNKTLNFDFGEDGAGEVAANGNFMALFQVGGQPQQITSNGEVITVRSVEGGYVGLLPNGDIAFSLRIDTETGEYFFQLNVALDHPENTDVMWLKFGVDVVDADGDVVETAIVIDLHDSVPVANDDTEVLDLDVAAILSGDVTANDVLSQDVDNTVTQVKFEGETYDLPEDGSFIRIEGEYGTLSISSSGEYFYKPFDGIFETRTETFEASAELADGLQTSVTVNGITIEVAGIANGDLTYFSDPQFGAGFGVDNLDNPNDSQKVFSGGEALNVSLAQNATALTLAIAEIGPNNVGAGLDFIVTLSDGSTVSMEQQFVASQIVNGVFTFTIDSSMFGGLEIASVYLESTNAGQFAKSSWLLNSVTAEYPGEGSVQDQFEYILSDADGDTSSAILTINTQAGDQPNPQPIADVAPVAIADEVDPILFDDVLLAEKAEDVQLFDAIKTKADDDALEARIAAAREQHAEEMLEARIAAAREQYADEQAEKELEGFEAIIAETDALTEDIAVFVEATEDKDVNVVDFNAKDVNAVDAKTEFVALDVNIVNDNGFIQNDETNVV